MQSSLLNFTRNLRKKIKIEKTEQKPRNYISHHKMHQWRIKKSSGRENMRKYAAQLFKNWNFVMLPYVFFSKTFRAPLVHAKIMINDTGGVGLILMTKGVFSTITKPR